MQLLEILHIIALSDEMELIDPQFSSYPLSTLVSYSIRPKNPFRIFVLKAVSAIFPISIKNLKKPWTIVRWVIGSCFIG